VDDQVLLVPLRLIRNDLLPQAVNSLTYRRAAWKAWCFQVRAGQSKFGDTDGRTDALDD